MRRKLIVSMAAALGVAVSPALAQVNAADLQWAPVSSAYRPGALSALVYGDPAAEGLSVVRLKIPPGYTVAPHTHSTDEYATVLAGEVTLSLDGKTHELKAGGFVRVPPGVPHSVSTSAGTELEIVSPGPRTIVYVNPSDDPRRPN